MAHILRKPAPRFTAAAVHDNEFREVSLQDYVGKYLAIFFYSMDFTGVCASEVMEFANQVDEFKRRNCEVLGISCDSQFTHLAWLNKLSMEREIPLINVTLLSDKTGKISREYGVYNEDQGISEKAFFIIDKQLLVREMSVNDHPVARSVDEILSLLDALHFSDEYGQDETLTYRRRGLKRAFMNQDSDETLCKSSKMSDEIAT